MMPRRLHSETISSMSGSFCGASPPDSVAVVSVVSSGAAVADINVRSLGISVPGRECDVAAALDALEVNAWTAR